MMVRFLPLLLLAAASAASAETPVDPVTFFEGTTHGDGRLSVLMKRPVTIKVDSVGHRSGDSLILDQKVQEAGKPTRHRRWILKPVGPGRYHGTLTDAASPVTVTSTAKALHIRYAMKNGLKVEQTLTPAGDGRSMDNIMKIRKFGLQVATLHERIEKR